MTTNLTEETTSKTIETQGMRIHYHEAGSGDPVVLLHFVNGIALDTAVTSRRFQIVELRPVEPEDGVFDGTVRRAKRRIAELLLQIVGYFQSTRGLNLPLR